MLGHEGGSPAAADKQGGGLSKDPQTGQTVLLLPASPPCIAKPQAPSTLPCMPAVSFYLPHGLHHAPPQHSLSLCSTLCLEPPPRSSPCNPHFSLPVASITFPSACSLHHTPHHVIFTAFRALLTTQPLVACTTPLTVQCCCADIHAAGATDGGTRAEQDP